MNKLNLDALMIDRALGALSPDTEALLEAYLSQNPGMAMDLDRTTDAVDLLRDILKEEPPLSLPDFKAHDLSRQRRRWRGSLQAAGMAATLAIGLFLGRSHMVKSPSVLPAPFVAVVEAEPAPQADSGIWSMAPTRRPKRVNRSTSWKWYSPVQQPRYINKGDA